MGSSTCCGISAKPSYVRQDSTGEKEAILIGLQTAVSGRNAGRRILGETGIDSVQDSIRIRGARVHNLKDISLSIPHNQLTVVTGVSGSGKSSLAFDTIYAEGQRRYVESLSAYARQFLERMEKPDVDEIDGIAPAVAIRQKNTTRNPRSTVATSTECYDFLRLLFARAGRTYCPNCGARVRKDTVDQVAARMLAQPEGSRWYALFPCGEHASDAGAARPAVRTAQEGIQPAVSGGAAVRVLDAGIAAGYRFLEAAVRAGGPHGDRPDLHQRLVDTVEICYREAGEVIFESAVGRRRGCASTKSSRARRAAWSSPSRSRACSASTGRSAPARAARGSATPSITTWTW